MSKIEASIAVEIASTISLVFPVLDKYTTQVFMGPECGFSANMILACPWVFKEHVAFYFVELSRFAFGHIH